MPTRPNSKGLLPRPSLPKELAEYAVIDSYGPQQPATLVIDQSGSMTGTPIDQVNKAAVTFAEECLDDIYTRDRLQIQFVAFGGHVRVQPFVPISKFIPPRLTAGGGTPLEGTERFVAMLQQARLEIPRPYYFLLSDGCPSSPRDLLDKTAAVIAQLERARRGTFYGFGIDAAAVEALQPLFTRAVRRLPKKGFAAFFRIVSLSVRLVSSGCISEDDDIDDIVDGELRNLQDDDDA
jgi:uncharacterized protein YegL